MSLCGFAGGVGPQQHVVRLLVLQTADGKDERTPRRLHRFLRHPPDLGQVDGVVDHPHAIGVQLQGALQAVGHLVRIGQEAVGGAVGQTGGALDHPAGHAALQLILDHRVGVVALAQNPPRAVGAHGVDHQAGEQVHALEETHHHVRAVAADHPGDIDRRQGQRRRQLVRLVETGVVALEVQPLLAHRRNIDAAGVGVGQERAGAAEQAHAHVDQAGVAAVEQMHGDALGAAAMQRRQ